MDKKVRFALVGCGRIGSRHAEHIFKNPRAQLLYVCDIKKDRADNFAKKYGAKAVYDFDELIKLDFDVVNICTPSGLHASMSIAALDNGRNVLCEKPMTLNLEDADKIMEAERRSGKKFMLVKQNKYNPPVAALKDAVFNEQLGKITLIHSDVFWNRHRQYYMEDYWRGTMKFDGGALMTQCSHFLDLMVWIGGPVKSVYAQMANIDHPYIETEDTGFITLHFKNGAIGSLQYTTATYQKNMEGTLTAIGNKGVIKIGGEYINILEYWNVEGVEKPDLPAGNEANDYGTYKGSMSNHDKIIQNVVEVLLDSKDISTNSMQGRESIEVMQAAYISALEHREVRLPLHGANYKFKLNEEPPFSGHRKEE